MPLSSMYTITAPLCLGGSANLYRARQNADGRSVVLKVLEPTRSRAEDRRRLRHEYEIGGSLTTPAVVKALALDAYQGMPALVLEDFGGESLDRLLGARMPVGRFLRLAIPIAAAVALVHQQGIVHRDLKPHNILFCPATGEVKITDLGMASRLPRGPAPPRSPGRVEGSLPYMSPEQTGRMNRAVDSRSDLYALGVSFYQMLTGRLPFEARDPPEWLHCHVARTPQPPSEVIPEIPGVLLFPTPPSPRRSRGSSSRSSPRARSA